MLDQNPYDAAAAACVRVLFRALVESDSDAAVLYVNDRPRLVTPLGQIELAAANLTTPAVESLIDHLLPADAQQTLDVSGEVQYECPAQADLPGERFAVVAVRFDGDVRAEVRRFRIPDEDLIPDFFWSVGEPSDPPQNDSLALPSAEDLWPAI